MKFNLPLSLNNKWAALVFSLATLFWLLHVIIEKMSKTSEFQLVLNVVLPVFIVVVFKEAISKWLCQKPLNAWVISALLVTTVSSQFVYNQYKKNKIIKVNSLSEVMNYSNELFFELATDSVDITLDDFHYKTKIRNSFGGRRSLKTQGIYFRGLAAKEIVGADGSVWLIDETRHFIPSQFKPPDKYQLEEYLAEAERNLKHVSATQYFQRIDNKITLKHLGDHYTKLGFNFLNEKKIILKAGQPNYINFYWAILFFIVAFFSGLWALKSGFKLSLKKIR